MVRFTSPLHGSAEKLKLIRISHRLFTNYSNCTHRSTKYPLQVPAPFPKVLGAKTQKQPLRGLYEPPINSKLCCLFNWNAIHLTATRWSIVTTDVVSSYWNAIHLSVTRWSIVTQWKQNRPRFLPVSWRHKFNDLHIDQPQINDPHDRWSVNAKGRKIGH